MPRRKLNLNLSAHEKRELEDYLKEYGSQPRIVKRCRIILMTDEGIALQDIADLLGLSKTTVNAWRQIYLGRRLAGLTDRKQPGRPAKQGRLTVKTVTVRLVAPGEDRPCFGLPLAVKPNAATTTGDTVWIH
jgi:hypothetical protein